MATDGRNTSISDRYYGQLRSLGVSRSEGVSLLLHTHSLLPLKG